MHINHDPGDKTMVVLNMIDNVSKISRTLCSWYILQNEYIVVGIWYICNGHTVAHFTYTLLTIFKRIFYVNVTKDGFLHPRVRFPIRFEGAGR